MLGFGTPYISFDFYNGRLSKLGISYDTSIRWRNVQEFAEPLTVSLKILVDAWVFHGDATGSMACKGFTIEVNALRNRLTLTDTDARAAFVDEQKRKEEEKKKNFKP